MNSLDQIALDFYQSFYHKQWSGEAMAVKGISMEEAYKVQDLVTEKRIEAGERIAGFKVGCTSGAIRNQFGLTEPISGKLFHPHILDSAVKIDWSDYINCAVEPEMVFKIGKDVVGTDLSDRELVDAIAYVSPGIEIHEFNFWVQPPTIQELICTGGIHTGLIVGDQKVDPADVGFEDEIFYVFKNTELITSAPCSEIMGGPIHSFRWLVNFLTKRGWSLKKGMLVIPGSPVELVSIDRDTELKVVIDNVGSLTSQFKSK